MNAFQNLGAALVVGTSVVASGCASVMSGRHADISFYSNVPNAQVSVTDSSGMEVANTSTPGNIAIKRKTGFILPAKYTATFSAPGYESEKVVLRQKVNPWVLGNVIFLHGGLIGLGVDNATGAAWRPKDTTIYRELAASAGQPLQYSTAERQVDGGVRPASGEILPRSLTKPAESGL